MLVWKISLFLTLLATGYCKTTEEHLPEGEPEDSSSIGKSLIEDEIAFQPVNHSSSGNDTHGEHTVQRFPIMTLDFARVQTPLIIGLWIFCACLGKIAFHMTPKLSRMFPESCMLIIMGLVIGAIFVSANPNEKSRVSPLTANSFFLYLLPPIILDAGYFMPNRLFFDHLGTILTFAVIGTIWNAMTIGISLYSLSLTGLFGDPEDFPMLHIFLFSSLVSAVDPVAVLAVFEEIHVEEVLFILVFGESLLNDGVTVVLYHMFEGFSHIGEDKLLPIDIVSGLVSFLLVALGGTVIGIIWGFLTAFVTRFTHQVRVIEPIFIFVMSYMSYLNAELFHWSGILAITFCGITMKNYTEQNMSQKSQTTTKYAMKMLASSAETVIFLFLGVATIHGTEHRMNTWFIVFTILFCSVYRVLGVLILSALCNRFRVLKIDFVQKFVMSYGGLRGAVAFALAITINPMNIPLAPMFVTTTIAMVFFTVFIQGITIKPLVEKLGVKKSEKRKLNMNERLHGRSIDYIMTGIEDISGKFGNYFIRGWFKRIHNHYLQPCFVRSLKAKEPKLFETLSHLRMQDAMNYMQQKPASINDLESFSKVLQNNLYTTNNVREWNLDTGGLEYKVGERDINEARFHHILSDDYHPIKARRQSTYKRHAVSDDEIETNTDFHNKMCQRARQVAMTSIRNRKLRKQTEMDPTQRAVQQQQFGDLVKLKTDYLHEKGTDNLGFEDDSGRTITQNAEIRRMSKKGPSVAETAFPWKRFNDNADDHPPTYSKIKRSVSIQDGEEIELPPTMAEIQLPWKRTDDDDWDTDFALRKSEFPPWADSKSYTDCYSPTNTFLGKVIGFTEKRPTIKDIFAKRHSSVNLFSRRNSHTEDMPTLRKSAKDDIYLRRGSLKTDPTAHKRESVKDFRDLNAFRASLVAAELARQQEESVDRRSSRESLGKQNLINTVIMEEEQKQPSTSSTPQKVEPQKDHVINMNPAGDKYNDTHL